MNKNAGKRAEITSFQIISLVLAIIAFAIILAFIYGFQSNVNTNDDVCKLSVAARATAQNVVGGSGSYVPLKCTTGKICISDSIFGGSCSQFAGEQGVQTVHLSGSDSQKAKTIEEISANAMYDCWNMMGQGKFDIFSTISSEFGWGQTGRTCVICSRIALADNVPESVTNLVDVRNYLSSNNVPGTSQTYLQAFTDEGVRSFPDVSKDLFSSASSSVQTSNGPAKLSGSFSNNQLALVFMQIKVQSLGNILDKQASWGAATAGSAFVWSPGKTLSAVYALFSLPGIIAGASAVVVDSVVVLNNYMGQKAAAGYCGNFVSPESKSGSNVQGCSLVQIMPYSFKDISNLCEHIQGNP